MKARAKHRDRAMLVLSRKPLESIVIANNIVVTVLSILGSRVRLGIEAPRGVLIHRTELMDAGPGRNVDCDPQVPSCQ